MALVEKIDNMLQQRQIVVKALGTRIGIEDLVYIKYAGTSFHSIALIFICLNVTIYRNVSYQRYETRFCIITSKLRSCI